MVINKKFPAWSIFDLKRKLYDTKAPQQNRHVA